MTDSWHLCIPQVSGGHLFCLPTHADDGLGAVRGRLCEETGAGEGAEAARGNVFFSLKSDPTCHCLSKHGVSKMSCDDAHFFFFTFISLKERKKNILPWLC